MRYPSLRHVVRSVGTPLALVAASLLPRIVSAGANIGLDPVADEAGLQRRADIADIIGNVVYVALGLVGLIFLVLIIYAGFLWMTAQGNSDQVDKAKTAIRNGVIGLVIVLSAYAITSFIVQAVISATQGA